ncbi:AAA family ATPase [Leeia sp. TBRC 13508]|uniref:AAA family ATPase n=1 Tax=Leeia speluncae TaxID=2884804 RepID=A0ABS8D3L0_9NEIS|nr:AAA family ATPase [Leeia speluncae]MCB6182791.1 AAA family ATPase [Leeia speluncae]
MLSFKEYIKRIYTWVPFLFSILDLFFYVMVPYIFMEMIEKNGFLIDFYNRFKFFREFNLFVFFSILICSILFVRSFFIFFLSRLMSISIQKHYADISELIVNKLFSSKYGISDFDKNHVRRLLNSEINNLIFGCVIPFSFCLAEVSVVLVLFLYSIYKFGNFIILFGLIISVFIYIVMLVSKEKVRNIGELRSSYEQIRQNFVEIIIGNVYSIKSNGGGPYSKVKMFEITTKFSSALSSQLTYPFITKTIIEGVIVFFLISVFALVSDFKSFEIAVFGGVALRALPAMSRISSYSDTIRISKIALKNVENFITEPLDDAFGLRNKLLDKYLDGQNKTGLLILKGPSGIGKTSSLKYWISNENAKVSYMDQSNFNGALPISELIMLIGGGEHAIPEITTHMNDLGIDIRARSLSELSGGQLKFLQFLLIALKTASIYVFDEPTVGLDNALKRRVLDIIKQKSINSRVVVVSHDSEFIEECSSKCSGVLYEVR